MRHASKSKLRVRCADWDGTKRTRACARQQSRQATNRKCVWVTGTAIGTLLRLYAQDPRACAARFKRKHALACNDERGFFRLF